MELIPEWARGGTSVIIGDGFDTEGELKIRIAVGGLGESTYLSRSEVEDLVTMLQYVLEFGDD